MHKKILAALCLMAAASTAQAQVTQASNDQTYLDFQVESPVRVKEAVAPHYPEELKSHKVAGEVIVQFVVNETGEPIMSTFKVLKSNDNAFSDSVKRAVGVMSFYAAVFQGRNVKQLVQVPFKFVAK